MKNTLITMLLIMTAMAAAQPETESNLTVEEIFSAETPQELETALTDGYPMPWLEEILNDNTIPEEDRYWLDCRVRAVIARELHAFFDREGNRIDVTAEGGIRNGEAYWRETFIVEPDYIDYRAIADERRTSIWSPHYSPEYPEPYRFRRTPGYLCNGYGERIGDLATTDFRIHLSRDGSVGVFSTGEEHPSRVFFLNSRNEVKEIVIGPRVSAMNSISISDDGSMALVVCASNVSWRINTDAPTDLDIDFSEGATMMVFTGTGNLLYHRKMPDFPTTHPARFSPDNRFIAYPMRSPNGTMLLDAQTGETIFTWDIYGPFNPYFTRNSRYLCLPAVGGGRIYDCETGEMVTEFDVGPYPEYGHMRNYHEWIGASNELKVVTGDRGLTPRQDPKQYFNELFLNLSLISSERMSDYRIQEVSPNGYFIDMQNYTPFIGGLYDGPAVPYTVLAVRGDR